MPALNEYLIQQPRLTRLTNQELLTVFYAHVLELARLMQASEVPQDLDPVEIARSEDRWSWSVSLPMQVEKLWADLRKQVARAGATNARASAEAAKGKQVAFVRDEGLQRELQCFCRRLLFPAFTTTLSTLNAGAIRSVPITHQTLQSGIRLEHR